MEQYTDGVNVYSLEYLNDNFDRLPFHTQQAICKYSRLTEEFLEKHISRSIDCSYISRYQKLSEGFIERHSDLLNWRFLSAYQKLSEEFIDLHSNKVSWFYISIHQKLSEQFIIRHATKVYWSEICKYQKLSEEFIEYCVCRKDYHTIVDYQKLSKEFREMYKIYAQDHLWMYKDIEWKREYIRKHTEYELVGNKLIAYKSCRSDGYSSFNFQYHYSVGGEYESTADCNPLEENSFGLSAWSREMALKYCMEKLFKVEIDLEDLACITYNNKIRARKIKILEEIF